MIKLKQTPLVTTLKLYLLPIGIFFFFRILLFFTEIERVNLNDDGMKNILYAFIMGLRFDLVISGYLLFFPVLSIFLFDVFKKNSRLAKKIIFYVLFFIFSIAFILAAIDIPYFNQFFARLSIGALEWLDNPDFVFKMIFQETRYFIFIIPALFFIVVFYIFLKHIIKQNKLSNHSIFLKIGIYTFALGIMFLGIRGRISEKSPIRIGTAYFCNNAFLNQLGLNPVFTFMRSYFDSKNPSHQKIKIMDSDTAIQKVTNYLHLEEKKYNSPIARFVKQDSLVVQNYNVVIVIMESMSAAKMERHGNTEKLTPFLDSLSYQSVYFENIYTAGKHTFNGVFSTCFSFPAIYRQHAMKQMHRYNGIAGALKKSGYNTIYFTTHDGQFDNAEGFLRKNDFDKVISQKNYPFKEVKTTLGVPDDYMFRFSIPILNKLEKKSVPFLAVFMTASDHGPYYIPPYFTPQAESIKEQIVQYADWSLKQFVQQAEKQSWFKNTLFVFIADHGAPLGGVYDISLDYHHTPLIFYAPYIFTSPNLFSHIGGQIDVFPTIMGILQQSYLNNTLGIDLLNQKRPYIIINDDDKIGVLDNEFLLIMKENEELQLYKYKNGDRKNYAKSFKERVKDMENYAKSHLQVYQDMMNRKQTYENSPYPPSFIKMPQK